MFHQVSPEVWGGRADPGQGGLFFFFKSHANALLFGMLPYFFTGQIVKDVLDLTIDCFSTERRQSTMFTLREISTLTPL